MNSKEAFEYIDNNVLTIKQSVDNREKLNLIKQDLERLETLENENQELQETIGETHYKMVRSIKAIKLLKFLNAIAPLVETTYTSAYNGEDLTIYTINGSYLSKEQYELVKEVLEWAN